MARALAILALAGAGYYAYSQGWLDQPIADLQEAIGSSDFSSASVPGEKAEPEKLTPIAVTPLPKKEPPQTKEEALLDQYAQWVSGYAATQPELAAAIMWQESRGKATAVSSAGALGLMQVMPGTAGDMHANHGYGRLSPDRKTLLTPEGSIYFGTAYMAWLNKVRNGRSWEWYIRAYNGGPAGADRYLGGGKNKENDGYYKAVLGRWNYLRNRNKGEMA